MATMVKPAGVALLIVGSALAVAFGFGAFLHAEAKRNTVAWRAAWIENCVVRNTPLGSDEQQWQTQHRACSLYHGRLEVLRREEGTRDD
jgi:hypothetical protein